MPQGKGNSSDPCHYLELTAFKRSFHLFPAKLNQLLFFDIVARRLRDALHPSREKKVGHRNTATGIDTVTS